MFLYKKSACQHGHHWGGHGVRRSVGQHRTTSTLAASTLLAQTSIGCQGSSGRIVDCVAHSPWQRIDVGLHGSSQIPFKVWLRWRLRSRLCQKPQLTLSFTATQLFHMLPNPWHDSLALFIAISLRSRIPFHWHGGHRTRDLYIVWNVAKKTEQWAEQHLSGLHQSDFQTCVVTCEPVCIRYLTIWSVLLLKQK